MPDRSLRPPPEPRIAGANSGPCDDSSIAHQRQRTPTSEAPHRFSASEGTEHDRPVKRAVEPCRWARLIERELPSDARWALIEPTLTAWRKARLDRRPTGQPAKVELRDVFNAILYVNRTGIPWKYVPHDFPSHGTVYAYYAVWRDEGITCP